jgi:hypothetical protein
MWRNLFGLEIDRAKFYNAFELDPYDQFEGVWKALEEYNFVKLKADEFDQQFERYLKERFKPFRDKERPADYGRNLAPNPEKTPFNQAVSAEPSPSGDLIAIASGNRKDGELDIILVSAKDGSVIRNLTSGFDQDKGFEYITSPGGRFITVPWLSWSPSGDRLAYFVRAEKTRTLIIQNVLSRQIEQRIEIKTVDDPESPDFSPDGKKVVFAGLQSAIGDLFIVDLESQEVTNITKDNFADSGPTWSLDGKFIVYVARVSGNEKLFKIDPGTGTKTQITFGTHDDATAQFVDADTIVFPSTATDPNQPIDPDVSRNGNIYNIWTLSLKNGELRRRVIMRAERDLRFCPGLRIDLEQLLVAADARDVDDGLAVG